MSATDSCLGCEERHTACWGTCEKYKRQKERREEMKRQYYGSRDAVNFLAENIRKAKRRAHKA